MRAELVRRMTKRTTTIRHLVTPWTLILIITGLFQVFRGAPIDGAFFLGIGAVLIADAAGLMHLAGTGQPRLVVLLCAAAVLGTLMAFAPRHGIVEGVIVAGVGLSVLVFAWRAPAESLAVEPGVMPDTVRRGAILWSVLGVAVCVWEVGSFLLGLPSLEAAYKHPSISVLLDPLVGTAFGRIVFIAAWLLGGIALLRRGRAR